MTGRVQGVFFRASAKKIATQLKLKGWVRNLPDGSVESFACGDPLALEEYSRWLQSGPKFARVEDVKSEPQDCVANDGFDIC